MDAPSYLMGILTGLAFGLGIANMAWNKYNQRILEEVREKLREAYDRAHH